MRDRQAVLHLLLIMTTVSLGVAGIAIYVLYDTAIVEERARLAETAQSQARLIEAIARFDAAHSVYDHPEGARGATLSQIVDAHEHYEGFGKTGEFTLAELRGEHIVFLLNHRHEDGFGTRERHEPVSISSPYAEPMRRALLGESGTVIGPDYRGVTVLAAHEPVAELGWGIVAKIDLAEVRAPFVRAGAIAGCASCIVVAIGAVFFVRVSNPLVRRLEESEARSRAIVETAADGIITTNDRGVIDTFNQAAEHIFGHAANEMIGQNIRMLLPSVCAEEGDDFPAVILERGDADGGSLVREATGRRQDGTAFPMDLAVSNVRLADRRMVTVIVRDITKRKRAEVALAWEAGVNAAIAELSSALISAASTDDVAAVVLQHAKRLTSSKYGFVGYIDPRTGYLVCPTLTRDIWDICQVKDKSIVFERFVGLWGWVLNNRKPLLTNSPQDDPRSPGTPPGHLPIHRFLSAPALIGDKLVGQVALANPEHDYCARDLALVERLATLYAIAIQRRWDREDLQKAHDELERRVQERTAELSEANQRLRTDLTERKRLEKEILEIGRREQIRIGQDLHDAVGQHLTGIAFQAKVLENKLTERALPEAVSASNIASMINQTIAQARALARGLCPVDLAADGLMTALQEHAASVETAFGINCELRCDEPVLVHDDAVATHLYRIAQEAVHNAVRHGQARRIVIGMAGGDGLSTLTVEDDGVGLSAGVDNHSGMGLHIMNYRAKMIGATLNVRRGPSGGTVVECAVRSDTAAPSENRP